MRRDISHEIEWVAKETDGGNLLCALGTPPRAPKLWLPDSRHSVSGVRGLSRSHSSLEHLSEVREVLAVMVEINLEVVEHADLAERAVAPSP